VITNAELCSAYLDEPTWAYFRRKVLDIPDAELLARIEEALKFLFVATECTGSIPVTKEIDEIWHYWILQTQQYADLCRRLPAGEFIDHSSNDYLVHFDPTIGEQIDLSGEVKMLALYVENVENFGAFDADRATYWRLAAHLLDDLGWPLDELNDWLRTPAPAPT
jgi:hypothetical protein